MNTEAMLAVADVIEYFDRFDIRRWAKFNDEAWVSAHEEGKTLPLERTIESVWTDCRTVGCVAGWTLAWADIKLPSTSNKIVLLARRELGLTNEQAENLFLPYVGSVWWNVHEEYGWVTDNGYYSDIITAKDAADVLRRIARGELEL